MPHSLQRAGLHVEPVGVEAIKPGDTVLIPARVVSVISAQNEIPAHAYVIREGLIKGALQQHLAPIAPMLVFKTTPPAGPR